jgi:hypothetical protein
MPSGISNTAITMTSIVVFKANGMGAERSCSGFAAK